MKTHRVMAKRLKGFRDLMADMLIPRERMIARIRVVYERYGFIPLETPMLEDVEALGKFLPEAERPDAGIFAFRDDEENWVALRYDLTAPLSRFMAMNLQELPLPFRRYQVGPVFRVEKPGPGRFREFQQFDFDSVGTASMVADAEVCLIMCETLESLGIARGDYIVRVNNRKTLNGVLELIGGGTALPEAVCLNILRCIDKLDRLGLSGVRELLGKGRKDESGAFIRGVGLEPEQIALVMRYLELPHERRDALLTALEAFVGSTASGREGVDELTEIHAFLVAAGLAEDRVTFDPTVVRGLEYYTGPVFEGALTFEIADEEGQVRPFGSVFGGGRYDGLVERFVGQRIPATGASIGVDRLLAALLALGKVKGRTATASVLVTRLDKTLTAEYQRMAQELRSAEINAELYVGTQGIGKQFRYASQTGKIAVVAVGSDEVARGEVSIKDLRLGDELSRELGADRRQWLENQPAQIAVPRAELVKAIRDILGRYPDDAEMF